MDASIFIGTSGYSYDDWRGAFYPLRLAKGDMLSYYAREFSFTEVNSTYYYMPPPRILPGSRKKRRRISSSALRRMVQSRYDYLYDDTELGEWVPRVRAVAREASRVFIAFNNHPRGQAVQNARVFRIMLG
ncbi:MAG: DUF72 domain-containing protein [Bacillota bacterium]